MVNKVFIKGIIFKEFTYSHTFKNKKYYKGYIKIINFNKLFIIVPVITSKNKCLNFKIGNRIKLNGNIRTRNYTENNKKRVCISTFAYSIKLNTNKRIFSNYVELKRKVLEFKYDTLILKVGKNNFIPIIISQPKNFCIFENVYISGYFNSRKIVKNDNTSFIVYEIVATQYHILS